MVYRFKHLAVALSAALLMAFAFASCAPISDASVGAGSMAGNASSGAEAEIKINLPPIAASSNSLRSMTPEETDDARKQTASFRVTFSCNYKTVRREAAVGVDTVSASFYVGTDVSVMVECLNSSGEVIVRTEPKTVKIRSSENKVSFKLSEDGTRIYPENPEPEPEPEPPQSTVRITFEAGYYISNTPGTPAMWNNMAGVTPPQAGDRTIGGSINETMTQNGYTFKGWVVTYNPSATSYNDQNFVTTYPSTAATLIGIWEENAPNTFTLSYDWGANDVQTPVPSAQGNITSGTNVNVEIPQNVTRLGYEFRGWDTTPNSPDAVYTSNNNQITITSDVTLYAVWSLINYNITYVYNGGIGTNGTSSFTINDTNISFGTVTQQGYTFEKWVYTSEPNTTATPNAAALIAKANGTTVSLTAQWTPTTYNVIYNSNAPTGSTASGSMPNTSRVFGQSFNLSTNNYTIPGYQFNGWYSAATGGTTVNGSSSSDTNRAGDITVYAKWSPKSYTVTFNSNNGTGSQSDQSNVTVASTAELPANNNVTISRQGCTFAGWTDSANGTTTYNLQELQNAIKAGTIGATGNSNSITLYAKWNELETLYVNASGNDTNGDGSAAKPFATLNKAFTIANGFTRNDITIHVKSALTGQGTGRLSNVKTYTLKADASSNITVDMNSGINVSTGTLKLENITLQGGGGITYIVGVTGGNVSLTNAKIIHTGSSAEDASSDINIAVQYTGGTLSMQGDSRITKVNINNSSQQLMINVPADITSSSNTILYLNEDGYNYKGNKIISGSGIYASYDKFTIGNRSKWQLTETNPSASGDVN